MEKTKASNERYGTRTSRSVGLLVAALTVALILGAFAGIPRTAAGSDGIQRGMDADAARYQALGESYALMANRIQRGNDASAARWAALGSGYAQGFPEPSYPEVATRQYTKVSRFYVERMRAQISQASNLALSAAVSSDILTGAGSDLLAANPELAFARRAYRATAGLLAANPELLVARPSYASGTTGCTVAQQDLASNPELALARRASAC